jgi:hypothetical protein
MVDALAAAADLIGHTNHALPDLNQDVRSAQSRRVVHQLQQEFAILHGNSFQRSAPPFSIIRSYPELIRSAARLIPREMIVEDDCCGNAGAYITPLTSESSTQIAWQAVMPVPITTASQACTVEVVLSGMVPARYFMPELI